MGNYGPNGRDTVFVLDDRQDITDATSNYFESLGIRSIVAGDIEDGWAKLESGYKAVKLALVDKNIHQDREAGLTFYEEARRKYPDIAFVLITAWSLLPGEKNRIDAEDINWLDKGALVPENLVALYRNPSIRGLRGRFNTPVIDLPEGDFQVAAHQNELQSSLRGETIQILRQENRSLRTVVQELAGDLLKRLSNDRFSRDDSRIFIDGRDISMEDLMGEIENCTNLGMRLLKAHSAIVDDVFGGKLRRRGEK